jgi:hypothetical protein
MSDPVLDLLESPPAPAMHVDEQSVVARGRTRWRRRRWAQVAASTVAACCAGIAVAAWPTLRPIGDAATPAGSSTVTNAPGTAELAPIPCGTSAKLFADTKDVVVGRATSRRVIVHRDTCRGGVMLTAGKDTPDLRTWDAAYGPAGSGGMPDRAFFLVVVEPGSSVEEKPDAVAYAVLPPRSEVCGWSALGYKPPPPPAGDPGRRLNQGPTGAPAEVLGLTDGWTAVITGLDGGVDDALWRMDVCEPGDDGKVVDRYTVKPFPVTEHGNVSHD